MPSYVTSRKIFITAGALSRSRLLENKKAGFNEKITVYVQILIDNFPSSNATLAEMPIGYMSFQKEDPSGH